MADIQMKLRYTFDVNGKEFALIRRALENFGPPGADLCRQLCERHAGCIQQLQDQFAAALAAVSRLEDEGEDI
jgi:hypothetical protein